MKPPSRPFEAVYLLLAAYDEATVHEALAIVAAQIGRSVSLQSLADAVTDHIEAERADALAALCEQAQETAARMAPVTRDSHAAWLEEWYRLAAERREEQWQRWVRKQAQDAERERELRVARQKEREQAATGTKRRAMALADATRPARAA